MDAPTGFCPGWVLPTLAHESCAIDLGRAPESYGSATGFVEQLWVTDLIFPQVEIAGKKEIVSEHAARNR
jgi:hypothetical protein